MGLHSDSTHEFIKLLTGHQPSLRAFIVSLLPGSDDIDDILQDTNVVLWEKMDNFSASKLGNNISLALPEYHHLPSQKLSYSFP